jgi:type II secretory pathway pseudopilin PulG
LELLVVIAIVAVLIGILVPAVQKIRAAAQRTVCTNNLKQVGLALHQYHGAHGVLPPGCSFQNGADPFLHMGWLTRLMPYLEQDALWQQAVSAFGRERFFETPPHFPILGQVVRTFICPSDDRNQAAWDYGVFQVAFTDYLGVEGTNLRLRDGVLFTDSRVRLTDITDGTSRTLGAGERPPSAGHSLGWWYAGWGQEQTGSAESILGVRELRIARAGTTIVHRGLMRFRRRRRTIRATCFISGVSTPAGRTFSSATARSASSRTQPIPFFRHSPRARAGKRRASSIKLRHTPIRWQ